MHRIRRPVQILMIVQSLRKLGAGDAPNGNVSAGIGSSNTLDGSPFLILKDLSGGLWDQNPKNYQYLGERFPGQCLYFDFYLENDRSYGLPYHPTSRFPTAPTALLL